MLKKISLAIFIFYFSAIFATSFATTTLIQFCPESPNQLKAIYKDLSFLKTASDTLRIENGCNEVKTLAVREKLFTRYIQQKYPNVRVSIPQQAIAQDLCHIELTRKDIAASDRGRVAQAGGTISVAGEERKAKTSFVGKYSVLSGNTSKIQFDQIWFSLTCTIVASGYNIRLKSLSPTLSLETQAFVKLNQIQELASFKQDSEDSGKNIQIIKNKIVSSKNKRHSKIFIKAGQPQVIQ